MLKAHLVCLASLPTLKRMAEQRRQLQKWFGLGCVECVCTSSHNAEDLNKNFLGVFAQGLAGDKAAGSILAALVGQLGRSQRKDNHCPPCLR